MNIFINVALLILGFAMLVKGSFVFVDACVNIAQKLKIPSFIIGLTIVAAGTNTPEAAISVTAAISGSNALAIGNVIGSNVFNMLVVVGLCAVIKPLAVNLKEMSLTHIISVVATFILFVMVLLFYNNIPRIGSAIFLIGYIIYVFFIVRQANKDREIAKHENANPHKPILNSVLYSIVGIALIIVGSKLTVNNALDIGLVLGISERILGLTVIAIGTSLPELAISLIAIKKGESGIAIGNIVGSNIFNILFILGLSGMLAPLDVYSGLVLDLVILLASSFVFLLFAYTGKRFVRLEGLAMLMFYVIYMSWLTL